MQLSTRTRRLFILLAGIALEVIIHARDSGIVVLLVDTAGSMQDNEPLVKALSKLILGKDAKNGFSRNILTILGAPGLLLFDGEALVGTEYLVLI